MGAEPDTPAVVPAPSGDPVCGTAGEGEGVSGASPRSFGRSSSIGVSTSTSLIGAIGGGGGGGGGGAGAEDRGGTPGRMPPIAGPAGGRRPAETGLAPPTRPPT